MSTPLEPTEEQLRAMFCARIGREWAPEWERNWSTSPVRKELAREFAVVRDHVLEEAVKVSCRGLNLAAELACASRIRALKGSP